MFSTTIIGFVVLKILKNQFPCKRFCLQITADVTKTTKNIHGDQTLIFNEHSENVDCFMERSFAVKIKNNLNLIKKLTFFRKENCVRMHNCAEIFRAIDVNIYRLTF